MFVAFMHGFILALGLILPLGVQNVFIFNQGAVQPMALRVLPAVVTAALCDTALILLAVGGVSVIVLSVAWLKTVLTGIGALFLLYAGWVIWNSRQTMENNQEQDNWTVRRQIAFAVSVSLLNPHAILDTVGVIGTSSLAYDGAAKLVFTAACITVSWLWFCLLAAAGRMVRTSVKAALILTGINRVSAVIMWISAGYLLWNN